MGANASNLNNNAAEKLSQCPVNHGQAPSLNNIPADLANQQISSLSTQRELSSIPRAPEAPAEPPSSCPMHTAGKDKGKEAERWVYPSPQQFQNALARKGKEAPEESVAMMVQIHNFLNERAWQEILRLEDSRAACVRFRAFGRRLTLSC
jgi:cytochrome c heme-lyase